MTREIWPLAKLARSVLERPEVVRRALAKLQSLQLVTRIAVDEWQRTDATSHGHKIDDVARRVLLKLSLPVPMHKPFMRSVHRPPGDNCTWYARKPVTR